MSRGGSAMRPVSSFTLPSGWVTRVAATEDFQALSTVAAELADHIGFTGVTYSLHDMTLRRSATSETPMAWFANYPEAWIKRYVARDYARNDPVIMAAAHGRPFRWGDLDVDAMTAVQRAVLTEARDFGLPRRVLCSCSYRPHARAVQRPRRRIGGRASRCPGTWHGVAGGPGPCGP